METELKVTKNKTRISKYCVKFNFFLVHRYFLKASSGGHIMVHYGQLICPYFIQ